MIKTIVAAFALMVSSHLYAGWSVGGGSGAGRAIGPDGEFLIPSKELKEILVEAAVNGVIILPSDEGVKELVPATFDFKKNLYKFRNVETDEQVILKDLDVDSSN